MIELIEVKRYTADQQPCWDAFVQVARNGVFLFERRYMDYHAARFTDASLMVYGDGELIAVMPANRNEAQCVSHGGLTFGGLVLHARTGATAVFEILQAVARALRDDGITRWIYRPVPHIYHRQPTEDDLYALHRLGAKPVRMDVSTTIDTERRPPLAKGRRHALSKARRAGIEVRSGGDLAAFWALLRETLSVQHGIKPTHTIDEINGLAERFRQIEFHGAYDSAGALHAGALTYHYDHVMHVQYMAASPAGRALGALDAVLAQLIDAAQGRDRWFNFGISTADQGRMLNAGLVAQKEMFGGRSTIVQTLELDLEAPTP